MKITYYGHSCFGVEINGKHLLFDPFITPNKLASKINIDSIPCDYLLITHGHRDHIADAESIAKRTGAQVIGCFEVTSYFNKRGIDNIQPMNTGGKAKFDFGNVKAVVALHSSSFPDGSYAGVPLGFVIESSEGNFYYAGDTALTYDMKLIGEYRSVDFAFMPIGDIFTMSVDNAIIASDFIQCDKIIGMHYDTFDPIKIDHSQSQLKFERAGKELILMDIGQSFTI